MNTSKTRNLYYVMDEKEEMFVKGNLNNHENSYTGEIDRAFRTYSKEEAIHISNECNDIGMNTKVVMFTWRCTLVARNVKGIENICVPVLQHIFTKLIAMGEIER